MRWLVRSTIDTLYPRTEAFPGAADCGLDDFLPRFQRQTTMLMWVGVVLGSLVFQLTPLFTVFVPLPAMWLPRALADRHAERITTTNVYLVRQALFLVKMVAGLVWGTHPSVRAKLALPALETDPGTWRQS